MNILESLLRAIHLRPLASIEQLSEELNISPALAGMLVADLTKKGYLKSYEDCLTVCDHCPVSYACDRQGHPKIWSLTDKGRELAGR
ncbi:MAG: MarR family transcriptional regulator [Leptolinea sp.]|jgi:DNA-binding MarR family transcriptional regulator|nr:MarR family transcriptional regulator [Leptolinea sp.]